MSGSFLSAIPQEIALDVLYYMEPEELQKNCKVEDFAEFCDERFYKSYAKKHDIESIKGLTWEQAVRTSRILDILSVLGPIYHGDFGIYPDEDEETEEPADETVLDFELNKKQADIFHAYEDRDWIIPYNSILAVSRETIPYRIVNIINRYPPKRRSKIWYNRQIKWNDDYAPYLRDFALPVLGSRFYIRVDKPFERVSISADIKGFPITIDDILFATRALMGTSEMSVNGGYHILREDPDKLVLEAIINDS